MTGSFQSCARFIASIEQALGNGPVAEKADRHPAISQVLGGKRRSGGDGRAAADDGVGAQVAGSRVGNVHRSAFAPAVPGFFAEQLREHELGRGSLGQAVPVAAMRAGDVIVGPQRGTDADGNRLFADIQVRQARHQSSRIEVIGMLLEQANSEHPPVHIEP